jgi:hypothetical protein
MQLAFLQEEEYFLQALYFFPELENYYPAGSHNSILFPSGSRIWTNFP